MGFNLGFKGLNETRLPLSLSRWIIIKIKLPSNEGRTQQTGQAILAFPEGNTIFCI